MFDRAGGVVDGGFVLFAFVFDRRPPVRLASTHFAFVVVALEGRAFFLRALRTLFAALFLLAL